MSKVKEVTQEQIDAWKKKHGDVIEFTDPATGDKCYLSKPSRKVLSFALTEAQNNPLGLVEAILENCWLGGNEDLKKDDAFVLGINSKIDQLVQIKTLEIKKL